MKVNNAQNFLKDSINENKENIGVLQAINVIYITIIFFLFVIGLYFLGIWALLIGVIFLPMFSFSYNYIAANINLKSNIKVSDIFIGRKAIMLSFTQYYKIYKKPLIWGFLGFFIANIVSNILYLSAIGMDQILNSMIENGDITFDVLLNSTSYMKFTLISEIVCIIIGYFVFTLTRQKYQFAPIILQNCNTKIESAINVSQKTYLNHKKIINKGNLCFLAWWLISFFIAGISLFLFDKYNLFTFDVSMLISLFIFLFLGSFSISPKVLFKNKMYYYLLDSKIQAYNNNFSAK